MTAPILRVEDLTVAFGAGREPVVGGVSFEVAPGECFAIVGESGSGKSVTARTLLGHNRRRIAKTIRSAAGSGAALGADGLDVRAVGRDEMGPATVELVRGSLGRLISFDSPGFIEFMREMDKEIEADAFAGETTAVVAMVSPQEIVGASVGDSEAWVIGSQGYQRLTQGQMRKPVLGSGAAMPVAFDAGVVKSAAFGGVS